MRIVISREGAEVGYIKNGEVVATDPDLFQLVTHPLPLLRTMTQGPVVATVHETIRPTDPDFGHAVFQMLMDSDDYDMERDDSG